MRGKERVAGEVAWNTSTVPESAMLAYSSADSGGGIWTI
jgi:hypothetical protein